MAEEENIKNELENKFASLQGKIAIKRQRRIFADAPYENFNEILNYSVKNLGFSILCTITGLDEVATLGVIYHLARTDGIMLNLRIHISHDNPAIKTVTDTFPGADIYEREMKDLLGIEIEGLADGPTYPLPEGWPAGEYPLRKDWKGTINIPEIKTGEENA